MSGGYFNYAQYQLKGLAVAIDELVIQNDGKLCNKTIERFKETAAKLRKAEEMVQCVDRLVCGDDNEESFHSQWPKSKPNFMVIINYD